MNEALRQYLADRLRLPGEVDTDQVAEWRKLTTLAGKYLADALDEPPEPLSSAEEVLLALPDMEPAPRGVDEISAIVRKFFVGVQAARSSGDQRLLEALAEYGRRYEIIAEVELPLLEPATVTLAEDRPLRRYFPGRTTHHFPLGDALSAHLEVRSDDPQVVIAGKFDVRDAHEKPIRAWFETVRWTPEALALYSSEPHRPRNVEVKVRLRLRWGLLLTTLLLALLNVAAAAITVSLASDQAVIGKLAVLAVPTTLATTFALVREQSALALRLQRLPRLLLALTIVGLWVAVLTQLTGWSEPPKTPQRTTDALRAQPRDPTPASPTIHE